MINLTSQPLLVVHGVELDQRIRAGIARLIVALNTKYGAAERLATRQRSPQSRSIGCDPATSMLRYFETDKLPKLMYGQDFVEAVWGISQLGPRNEGQSAKYKALMQFVAIPTPPSAFTGARLKGFFRLLMLALWAERAVMLPFGFQFGGSALLEHDAIIHSMDTVVSNFFRQYKQGGLHRPEGVSPLPLSGAEMLYKLGPRVACATDWQLLSDVSIQEVSEFYKAMNPLAIDDDAPVFGSRPPLALMLRELATCHPGEITFSGADVDVFAIWVARPSYHKTPFHEFLANRSEIEERVRLRQLVSKRGLEPETDLDSSAKDKALLNLAKREDHEAVVEYFSSLRGIVRSGNDWLRHGAPYIGREHVNLKNLGALWLEAWQAYLNYRKAVQGFDSQTNPVRAFNVLCDYLFLYLPWWKEINPESTVEFPLAPKQFKRGIFVARTFLSDTETPSIAQMPMPILEVLPKRLANANSRYIVLHLLIQFFEWLQVGFEDDDRIAGPGFRSPICRLDLPRLTRKTKTTKVPFSRRVYPHLLYYSYALEAFGEYLQLLAMERPQVFAGRRLRQLPFMSTGPTPDQVSQSGKPSDDYLEDWPEYYGFVPFVSYRGKNYPITRLPNVFQWAERIVDLTRYGVEEPEPARRWLPHLTVLRMLIGAIETGLRLQSIQWLDVRTWDKENLKNGIAPSYAYNVSNIQYAWHFALPMLVSTDKTKDEPWSTFIVFRVRGAFYREQYFRESIREEGLDTAVDYDGIANSRFGQIVPLFRSAASAAPYGDSTYDRYWRQMLWGFEEHFNDNVSDENEFVQFVYLKGTDEVQVPDYSDTDISDIRAINTPHACRATYATNRTGLMEASDVAQQLGHSSTVVTAYYTVSTPERMIEALGMVERELHANHSAFDSNNPAYLRADSTTGSLYQGFQKDRQEAIAAFGFAPSVALWSTEDLKTPDGMELLKTSPTSSIRFRETHICPVGEACPSDVVEKIGEAGRCGVCPLAMRCVDHLPAIAAKINQLMQRIRSDIRRAEQLAERKEPSAVVDALYEAAERDANEILGWQLSHDILTATMAGRTEQIAYLVSAPEIVQRHLQCVTRDRPVSEFLLQRIADANAYPSLADPEIQRIADRFHRHIMGASVPTVEDDPVAILASLIKTQIEPRGLTLQDLATRIEQVETTKAVVPVLFAWPVGLLE